MKIVSWYDSKKIVYELAKATIRDTIMETVRKDTPLMNADLRNADLKDADLFHGKFWGRGGKTRIKKAQTESFLEALGIVTED